jgi:hypothetical protein
VTHSFQKPDLHIISLIRHRAVPHSWPYVYYYRHPQKRYGAESRGVKELFLEGGRRMAHVAWADRGKIADSGWEAAGASVTGIGGSGKRRLTPIRFKLPF